MIPIPRDMTPPERNAFNSVAADDVERELALRHAAELADRAARQRAADDALQAVEGPRAALVASGEARAAFAAEVEHVERLLPATCAAVILGNADERAEANLLERLAKAQRGLRRHDLARPLLVAMLATAQKELSRICDEVAELDIKLERSRRDIRWDLSSQWRARP